MPILSAENQFKKGLTALVDQNYKDAVVFFGRAVELDRERNRKQPDLRYLSYYGLALAKSGSSPTEALRVCRMAVSRHQHHPVLWLNLGRAYAALGKHERALEALDRGARLAPDNPVVARELAQFDRRSQPVIPRLSRSHPVNVVLGKLRGAIRRSRRSGAESNEAVPLSRS